MKPEEREIMHRMFAGLPTTGLSPEHLAQAAFALVVFALAAMDDVQGRSDLLASLSETATERVRSLLAERAELEHNVTQH